jgi:large subunit ribosomal protein L27
LAEWRSKYEKAKVSSSIMATAAPKKKVARPKRERVASTRVVRTATGRKKDDLKKIEGIGPKIEGLLNKDGIIYFEQLEKTPVERIQKILDKAGPRYRIHKPATWPQQSGLCARGEWEKLKKLQDQLTGGRK